ncbi:phenylacetate--CoA ligase family protein [Oceanicoccus sp. KOV_DT_Chl]|uniref:phenylacetate--CoA ligase family protein n=1 Tax=Oceanicoccus sp. KOV_DT_Chl TaxID=1904639 RepID=UPI000C7CD161|nr:phenylacetate--CoA ligase family protein [Oceanicoccus sp. KOV_DT_Chl]
MLKKYLEKIYYLLPVFFQNIAISVYGLGVRYTQHAGHYHKYYTESCARANFSADEMAAYVDKELIRIIALAENKVPYYSGLFKEAGITASDFSGVKDLHKIPLLEKSVIRSSPESLVNDDYELEKLIQINTTGSTGTPLKIYCTADVRRKNYAMYDRFLNQAGIRVGDRKATFGGRIVIPSFVKEPPFWRYNLPQRNLLCSSYHLADDNMPAYIDKLRSYRPAYIDSYPSSIYSLAEYAKKNQVDLAGMTAAITTSGETLHENQRQVVEEVFDARIYDQYGAAEMCLFIGQCAAGLYHIHSDFGVVELIDADGQPALPGEEAEVVCTGFINDVMPLIRYRIGDRAIAGSQTCSCGSPFPLVDAILGRNDDVIVTPEGRRVGRLSPVLKGFPVKEAQYLQSNSSKVTVKLVVGGEYNREIEQAFIAELRKRLGDMIEIECVLVEEIERGRGGKFKSILSTIQKN